MSVPFSIRKSVLPFPREIVRHVAVTWNNATIIFGSIEQDMLTDDFSVVYLHVSGKWIRKETAGHEPKPAYKSGAVVIDDKMLVLGDTFSGRNVIYSLDLNNWTWEAIQ